MARKGRVDRGLRQRLNSAGKIVWYARIGIGGGKLVEYGPFPTKTAARQHYEKCKTEQHEGRFNPDRYKRGRYDTLQVAIERYKVKDESRKAQDNKIFEEWWTDQYGSIPLNQITPLLLEEAMQILFKIEYRRSKDEKIPPKRFTPQTVLHYMKFLRHILNLAIRDNHLDKNPFAKVKLPRITTGKTRYLSPEEEGRLFKALGPIHGPWARFAILTGLRRSEQFNLEWKHVDLEKGFLTLPVTKAGMVQYVGLNAEAQDILRGFSSWQTSKWVFPSKNPSTRMDDHNFYTRVFLKAVDTAKLDGMTWHTLRHTFASRLAMSGQTESTIASLLRHSGTNLVRRYAHLSPSHLQQALEGLSSFGKIQSQPNRDKTGVEKSEDQNPKNEGLEVIEK